MVVSLWGRPPAAEAAKTPGATPARIGSRPVIIAARDGLHRCHAEYHVWKTIPSEAIWEMCGVRMVWLLPV